MKDKRNTSDRDEHKTPSRILRDVMLRGGAGAHGESRRERDNRTGRLKGADKAKYRRGDYDD